MLPRRLLPRLFALTLLFGQASAFAHALSHLDAHDSALPDQTCEVCIAQASLGSGVSAAFHWPAGPTIVIAAALLAGRVLHVAATVRQL
jgi:hypothetical protein